MAVKHRFLIFLLSAGLLAITTPTLATTARLAALGLGPDWVPDEREAVRWYASGVDHDGLAVMDLGRLDTGGGGQPWSERISGQAGGVHVRFDETGRYGTGAVYFHSQAVQGSVGHVNGDFPGGNIRALYARRFGTVDLGLGFGGSSFDTGDFNSTASVGGRSEYHHDLGLGLRWQLSDGLRLEAAGEVRQYEMWFSDVQRGIFGGKLTGHDSFGLRLRLQVQLGENITLVPLFGYTRDIKDIYSEQLDDLARLNGRLLRTGFVFQVRRPDQTRLFFNGEYQDGKDDQQSFGNVYRTYDAQQRDWYSFHVRTAVEAPLSSWLTVRASIQYRRVADTSLLLWPSAVPTDALTWQNVGHVTVDTPLGLGLAATWRGFTLDAAYNDKAPLSLANVPDANSPREAANFATVSLGYRY